MLKGRNAGIVRAKRGNGTLRAMTPRRDGICKGERWIVVEKKRIVLGRECRVRRVASLNLK